METEFDSIEIMNAPSDLSTSTIKTAFVIGYQNDLNTIRMSIVDREDHLKRIDSQSFSPIRPIEVGRKFVRNVGPETKRKN